MEFWDILYYSDLFFFIFVCLTVVYMGLFAMASMFSHHQDVPKTRIENRFIIFIPAYKNGHSAEQTVRSILGQTYPQRLFDVTVIADQLDEMSNFRLAQQPITLLTPNFTKSSRAKSLQLAEAAGTKAIQCHMLSQNRDTVSARLSAIFEEINNSIFRRGHVTLGLSAAAASSAMAFDFNWFKANIMTTNTSWDDKELESRLLRQHIFVDYFDDIMVFSEKTRNAEDFNRQRGRWLLSHLSTIVRNIRYLPGAIIRRHYDLADKIIQWMLLPRMLMMAIIIFMGVIMPFIYFSLALKWWALFAIVLFIFALATPNYLVDDKWDRTFFLIPVILMTSVLSKTRFGKKLKDITNKKL